MYKVEISFDGGRSWESHGSYNTLEDARNRSFDARASFNCTARIKDGRGIVVG